MDLSDTGLHEQPFKTHGQPSALLAYAAHRAALEFLEATYAAKHGLGLLQGPALSGKSTVAREFMGSFPADVSRALVDGNGLTSTALLSSVLSQFGYKLELTSENELTSMLRVFSMQQTAAGDPPILVIENTHAMGAEALHVLCELASITVNRQSALRIMLLSDRSIENIINAPEMECISKRVTGVHLLGPMTALETRDFLHQKLDAAGADHPAEIFPDSVCADVYSASNGWPGVVDRLALLAFAKAKSAPVLPEHIKRLALTADAAPAPLSEDEYDGHPRIYLTRKGKTLGEITLERPRLLIGRSEHNDLRINSNFISRHHAMFVRHGSATLLMDLNSTNGTFVNSRRVSNYVMMHDDIVSIGNHRMKFVHPEADRAVDMDQSGMADTVIMKTLDDMRRLLKQESTQTMPLQAMNALLASDVDADNDTD
jgi:type II secretory pathway predicted ATPase ExeA/pSer/pThr/pTyr-binding forkhead associated (FHA) protein